MYPARPRFAGNYLGNLDLAGIGYAFKWGDLSIDYRYRCYRQDKDKLIDGLSFGGLAAGANLRF